MLKIVSIILCACLMCVNTYTTGEPLCVLNSNDRILLYHPLDMTEWNEDTSKALGISVKDGKWHVFTESGTQLWSFSLKSAGNLTINLMRNEQEAFSGIYLFLLNQDQQIVKAAFVDEFIAGNKLVAWDLVPARYYLKMEIFNSSASYQSILINIEFDGEEEKIPLG